MKVDFCAIADHANVAEGGKLNVIGIFDAIRGKSFPLVHGRLVFVVRLFYDYSDSERERNVKVTLETPDGEKLLKAEGKAKVGTVEAGQFRHVNQIFELNQVPFERSGTYMFRVWIDNKQRAESTLRVVQAG